PQSPSAECSLIGSRKNPKLRIKPIYPGRCFAPGETIDNEVRNQNTLRYFYIYMEYFLPAPGTAHGSGKEGARSDNAARGGRSEIRVEKDARADHYCDGCSGDRRRFE